MEYINHFTFNTGDCRVSTPDDINRDFAFFFLPKLKKILKSGQVCDFEFGTKIEILEEYGHYTATLYIEHEENLIPVFVTMATNNEKDRKTIIDNSEIFRKELGVDVVYLPPEAPLIIDIVLPTIVIRMDLVEVTGDMSKCLAWLILDPSKILEA